MIPFLDLKSQYTSIQNEIDQAVLETLRNGQYVLGPRVEAFENNFAAYCGTKYAIGVNSGAAALHLALLAAGIGPGDEVITVSMTFVATVAAIIYCGAKPVFVDIDPVTWNMDPNKISAAITSKTKAILPVHLHGRMADMEDIITIAKANGLQVIEDAAQAHGAEYKGKRAGTMGNLGCFSFYPGKNLGAYGEAGAIVTNNATYAEKIRQLRDWGQTLKYHHTLQGFNYRMDGIQGAILDVKLKYLEKWISERQLRAHLYDHLLDKINLTRPASLPDYRHVYHVYAIQHKHRDFIRDQLGKSNIATNCHYPIPVHLQEAYKNNYSISGNLMVTERFAKETLSLPLFPELTNSQVTHVCSALELCIKNAANSVEELSNC